MFRLPMPMIKVFISILLLMGIQAKSLAQTRLQFEYHSAYLMNLHSFLLDAAVRGRDLASYPWVERPSGEDIAVLNRSIQYYQAHFKGRDVSFDDELVGIKHALSVDDGRRDVAQLSLPGELSTVLAQASPVYLRCLWPAQDAQNREWIKAAAALDAQYGAAVQAGIEHYMGQPYKQTHIRVDVVVDTGAFTGAYTDTQTVMPSRRADYQGLAALEMLYHEATHVDVSDKVTDALAAELKATQRSPDIQLWHVVHFYTVGKVVADVLKHDGSVDYVPYADKNGVYTRGSWVSFHAIVVQRWLPYMEGHRTFDDAIKAMVADLPLQPSA